MRVKRRKNVGVTRIKTMIRKQEDSDILAKYHVKFIMKIVHKLLEKKQVAKAMEVFGNLFDDNDPTDFEDMIDDFSDLLVDHDIPLHVLDRIL